MKPRILIAVALVAVALAAAPMAALAEVPVVTGKEWMASSPNEKQA
ncbi:MAG: hypothetical protein AB1918_18530 [Pseudomonadota bacterium]